MLRYGGRVRWRGGDLVVIRLNDRRLSTGRAWVKNGDRWQVTRRYDDGSLAARRLGRVVTVPLVLLHLRVSYRFLNRWPRQTIFSPADSEP